ncbi:aminotransferase class V-fold PLP-dependent enzyme [Bacillus salipaludis]|uniref:aminotransferase class V-fold PLP-dependent enzyme n=1 Tax=Bacillus salipaludis TaxID=2547811 RepID=UPI002E1A2C02|nr:aminotransferase class V-fold PLP-dependent enzyme [Bacillus salipaludis]
MYHRLNVDSWATAANNTNTKIRFISVDKERLTLDLILLDNLIDENTKLVAVTLASNVVGAITDVERIAKREK